MQETLTFSKAVYTYPSGGFTLSIDDLVLNTKEITCITGNNGSGKTTMAKLMTGIFKPLKGEVVLMGTPSHLLTLGEIGRRVGYLWQNPSQQLFAQTAMEELTFVEEMRNPGQTPEEKKAAEEVALEWLTYFDLAHLKDKSCFYLSQGERQRLALAAVIAAGASYLVLDEPTKGLDDKRQKSLSNILQKLRNEKKTGMSIISHDKRFIEELKERVIMLAGGEIVDG